MKSYSIIGLMSGTSMDGLDLAHCTLQMGENKQWNYTVNQAETVAYPTELLLALKDCTSFSANQLLELDKQLGAHFANEVKTFIKRHGLKGSSIDAIASHGHTVFHQPHKGYTYQIGCGATMASQLGIRVINDFRQRDVIMGGQGAPLVPIGDTLLFSDLAASFLNIGGFANICIPGKPVIAYDICPGNIPLNQLIQKIGQSYDENGAMASTGNVNASLLNTLNRLDFYNAPTPKSLGTEWLNEHFLPLIELDLPLADLLATIVEHIAMQVSKELNGHNVPSVLITGGGARNGYLLKRIGFYYTGEIIAQSEELIDFKEAIIFAFLGALHLEGQPNCLSSVTGASEDVCGGVLHNPLVHNSTVSKS